MPSNTMSDPKFDRLLEDVGCRLRFLHEIGVEDVPAARRVTEKSSPRRAGDPAAASRLGSVNDEILTCRKCGLAEGRTHAVPGEGDAAAELMFVGEGPGRDEDSQGRPFVGRAGQLLTKIIAAMTFERSRVFITNIVKCRPPENRVPQRGEVESCTPYLLRQVEIIRPRVIVSLGKTATDFFVPDATGGMTAIRGKFYDWNGTRIMPTFHPSYLVRNEGNREIKRMVWDDMRQVMALLGRT